MRTHRSGLRGRSLFGRLVLLLAVASALAACGRSSSDSSVSLAGSGGAQPSGTDVSPTVADGTPATIVSGDFTIQMGSYYDRTAASLAGDAEHYNLHVESAGLHIQGGTAKLTAGNAGSFRVCSHSSDDTNLLMIVPWSDLAAGGRYCASDDLGSHTMTLPTVRGASPGSSVMVHVDTWPCAEECWTTTGAN